MHRAVLLLVILGPLACRPPVPSPEPTSSTPTFRPLWDPQDTHHAAFEAPELPNGCEDDSACQVGGCGNQVCSAQADVMTTCQALPVSLPPDAACGCLEGSCQWYSPSGASPGVAAPSEDAPAASGCASLLCAPPTRCIEYFGVAGPQGPTFASCEIACEPEEPRCPEGLQCLTVADGPGDVCRAAPPEPDIAAPPSTAPGAGRKYDFVVSFFSPGDGTDHRAAERLATVVEGTAGLEHVQGRWGKEGEHDECFGLAALSEKERNAFMERAKAAVAASTKVRVETNAECRHRPLPH